MIVVLLWLTALVGMTLVSQSVGTAFSNSFSLPNTESTKALDLLQAAAPSVAGDREQIVFHTTNGTKVTDRYRWMEAEGPEWKTYALAEGAYAKQVLDAIPGRDALAAT